MQLWGTTRATRDIDILIEPTEQTGRLQDAAGHRSSRRDQAVAADTMIGDRYGLTPPHARTLRARHSHVSEAVLLRLR
jgi:hypothetical protein